MRWVSFGGAAPSEEAQLAEIRARFERGELPGPGWNLVRTRLERQVWRLPGPAPALFAKRQLYRSLRVRVRYCLRSSPLAREARMALELASLGLAVPEPLLLCDEGRGWRRRQSLLVTREAPGEPAAAALAAGRLGLLDLAGLLAELSRQGLFHPDLHLGNLLHGPEGPLLLDLQSVRRGRGPLRRGRLLAMAAKLGLALEASGLFPLTRWREALAAAGVLAGPGDGPALEAARERLQARERASRLRRCLRDSSGFAREAWGGGRLFRRRSASREEILAAARAALGRGPGFDGYAVGRFCKVGPGRALRGLWIELRSRELERGELGPAEALVERGWLRRRSCLVLRGGCGAEELAEARGSVFGGDPSQGRSPG